MLCFLAIMVGVQHAVIMMVVILTVAVSDQMGQFNTLLCERGWYEHDQWLPQQDNQEHKRMQATKHKEILARIFHQGRARVGCDAVHWQDATTPWARAYKEEQRRRRAAAQPNRVGSAPYKLDWVLEGAKVSVHEVLRGI